MPENGFRITELWAFLAHDGDDDEGVMGTLTPDGWVPMIGADPDRVQSLRSEAEAIAKVTGQKIVLARFTNRVNVETIGEEVVSKENGKQQ